MKKLLAIILVVVLVPLIYTRCVPHRLDEASLYAGPLIELKVVRYFENLPLHYTGEAYRVMCRSEHTRTAPGNAKQDPGWLSISNGAAIGSQNARELADQIETHYQVFDDQILVYSPARTLNVSFDACRSFQQWDPASLPATLLHPLEMDASCQPEGLRDCGPLHFVAERKPEYQIIHASLPGEIRFRMRSAALLDPQGLTVESHDAGRTWQLRERDRRAADTELPPEQGIRAQNPQRSLMAQ